MAQEEIILSFVADLTGVDDVSQSLDKMTEAEKKSAENFKKGNEIIASRKKVIQEVASEQKKTDEVFNKSAKNVGDLNKAINALNAGLVKAATNNTLKDFLAGIGDELKAAGIDAKGFGDTFTEIPKKAEKPLVSLRVQIRNLKAQLSELDEAGLSSSQAFVDIAVEAGKLENQVRDTDSRIAALASSTRQLDTGVEIVKGVASAFTLAQGAVGLFGKENEQVQQALLKVNSAMAILTGLTEVQRLIQKENIAVQSIAILQARGQALAVELETLAESKNIVVKRLATVAQLALNAAMNANPAVLLLTTVVALTAAFVYFTRTTESQAAATQRLNELQKEQIETQKQAIQSFNQFADAQVAAAQKELDVANALKKPLEERIALEERVIQAKLNAAETSTQIVSNEIKNLEANQIKIKELEANYRALFAAKSDEKVLESAKLEIDNLKSQIDLATEAKKNFEEAAKAKELFNINAENRLTEQALQNAKSIAEGRLFAAKEGTKDELNLRIAALKRESEIELFNARGNSAEIFRINEKLKKDISNLNQEFNLKNLEDQKTGNEILLQEAINNAQDTTAIQLQIIETNRKIAVAKAKGNSVEEAKAKVDADTQAKDLLQQNDLDLYQRRANLALLNAKQGTKFEVEAQKDVIEAKADADKLAVQNSTQSAELKKVAIEEIDAKARTDKEKLDLEFIEKTKKAEIDASQKAADERRQILEQSFGLAQLYLDNIFSLEKTARDKNTTEALDANNKLKDKELSNKKLTEEQKAKINEKYAAQERAIKNEAAQKEFDAKLAQATLNTFLAVSAILADQSVPTPAKPLAIEAAVSQNLLQIAGIIAVGPQKFAKGTEYVTGAGTTTSDSVPAMLSVGERVVKANTNKKYRKPLNQITRGLVPSNVAEELLTNWQYYSGATSSVTNNTNIDERKLARLIAEELANVSRQDRSQMKNNNDLLGLIANKLGSENTYISRR